MSTTIKSIKELWEFTDPPEGYRFFDDHYFTCHDVLQPELERRQSKFFDKEPFELFKERMQPFGEGVPVTLLCLSDGIDKFPEWVEYINAHKNYKIACHGKRHADHVFLSYDQIVKELTEAKHRLEETFNQHVTEFYPPKNRYNAKVTEAAREAGLKIKKGFYPVGRFLKDLLEKDNHPERKCLDYHYWHYNDLANLKLIFGYIKISEPLFIIGAPRSGTTALMRYVGQRYDNATVLKEVEKIWSLDLSPVSWYMNKVKHDGTDWFIDKNARNSKRILSISSLFPHARFLHIIRDGRGSANSWRNYATRVKKDDTSLEGATKQWIEYVSFILDNRRSLKHYKEVRYEDLCEWTDYFASRNNKWKIHLDKEEQEYVTNQQAPLLGKLGYI